MKKSLASILMYLLGIGFGLDGIKDDNFIIFLISWGIISHYLGDIMIAE